MRTLVVFILMAFAGQLFSQTVAGVEDYWTFENYLGYGIQFDPDTSARYSWEIGEPRKTFLNSAYSGSNVIITALDTSYSKGDTISFSMKHWAEGGLVDQGGMSTAHFTLAAYYKVDSDSLNDFGRIEVSPDNGSTWIDIVHNDLGENSFTWYTPIPVFTGRTDWTLFGVELVTLRNLYHFERGDSLLVKFSFISDSIETFRDGLMFDDIYIEDYTTAIEQESNTNLNAHIYPNPSNGILTITTDLSDPYIMEITSINGQSCHRLEMEGTHKQLDLSFLENGMYLVILRSRDYVKTMKLAKVN